MSNPQLAIYDPKKLHELVRRLMQKTLSGEIKWREESGRDPETFREYESFRASFRNYSVVVSRWKNENVEEFGELALVCEMSLVNDMGVVFAEISDERFKGARNASGGFGKSDFGRRDYWAAF